MTLLKSNVDEEPQKKTAMTNMLMKNTIGETTNRQIQGKYIESQHQEAHF